MVSRPFRSRGPLTALMKLLVLFVTISAFAIFIALQPDENIEVIGGARELLSYKGVALGPSHFRLRPTFTGGSVSSRVCAANQDGKCDFPGYAQVSVITDLFILC